MPLSPIAAQSEASRRNAVRHGLRGATIDVMIDEQDFLADTTASLECRWKPVDAVEHNLVQALALMELKLVRLDTIEMQLDASKYAVIRHGGCSFGLTSADVASWDAAGAGCRAGAGAAALL